MNGGLQELDEADWWLELLAGDLVKATRLDELRNETDQLIRIFVTCIRNAGGSSR